MQKNQLQKIASYCLYLVIILTPFNARHILNFEKIKAIEGFRENLSWSVYFFDPILIFLFIAILLIHFSHKRVNFNLKKVIYQPLFWLFLIIILNLLLSNEKNLAIYQIIRLTIAIGLFLSIRFSLRDKKVKSNVVLLIFIGGIFQSLIAALQFILQKSVGLKIIGESVIAPNVLGVAKFEIYGEKILRAYGTFPHPNLLAVFLVLSLASGWWLWTQRNQKIKSLYLLAGTLFIGVGLIATFSRSGFLAAFLLLILFLLNNWKKIANPLKIVFAQKTALALAGLLLILGIGFSVYKLVQPRLCYNCPEENSIQLRRTYSTYAQKIITEKPLLGVGFGSFTLILKEKSTELANYGIQPVHNLYLLIATELGVLGLVFWLLFVLKYSHATKRNLSNPFFSTLLVFLLVGFIDHYFWTLPQGQLIFYLSLALQEKLKVSMA